MLAYARARFVRTSPRKARLVIDAIRGKDVQEALAILKFTPNYAARLIEKVLRSAAANAANNHHMDGDNLKVAYAVVDGGPIMKRLRYAPMGRGYRVAKRLSHITIGVEETEPKPGKKGRKQLARTVKGPGQKPKAAAPAQPETQQPARKKREKPETAAPEVTQAQAEPETAAPVEVETSAETPVAEAEQEPVASPEPEPGEQVEDSGAAEPEETSSEAEGEQK